MHFSIKIIATFLLMLSTASCQKACQKKAETPEVGVFFESLKDNDEVNSPFEVRMGVKGMTVRPAMQDLQDKSSGHHHILIDHPQGFIEEGQVVPMDARHLHYGQAQTVATIELSPGTHTLSLQFADGAHLSYGQKMAKTITVRVLEPAVQN